MFLSYIFGYQAVIGQLEYINKTLGEIRTQHMEVLVSLNKRSDGGILRSLETVDSSGDTVHFFQSCTRAFSGVNAAIQKIRKEANALQRQSLEDKRTLTPHPNLNQLVYGAAGVIVFTVNPKTNEILVMISNDKANRGRLSFQGGRIDEGKKGLEDAKSTARRELFEETAGTLEVPLNYFSDETIVFLFSSGKGNQKQSPTFLIPVDYKYLTLLIPQMTANLAKQNTRAFKEHDGWRLTPWVEDLVGNDMASKKKLNGEIDSVKKRMRALWRQRSPFKSS